MARKRRRAIIGLEAAIVLIAFVIVAAALSFIVLNMGMFAAQRSKQVIARGLGEASTSLEIDGSVIGYVTDGHNRKVTYLFIPIRLAPGRESVDFNETKLSVSLVTPYGAYEDIYEGKGEVTTDTYNVSKIIEEVDIQKSPGAKIVFINADDDTVLEFGEKAILVVKLAEGLVAYDEFTVEIKPLEGASLLVERTLPPSLPEKGPVILG